MTDPSPARQSEPQRQIRIQLVAASVIVAIGGIVWLSKVGLSRNWPVVTATLSDVQTVACTRSCGSAKALVYATIEFDRPVGSGPAHCRIENYNIARGDEKLVAPTTLQIAVGPDSCDDWRLVNQR